ncbi:hypothetical protein Bca52824_000825 [Brassica carinata]|uniref:Uncharacterized protein n=1 Tax=Brassica carinata TaxID=52824 RepID=A0A8X7WI72_BRACI|nr:hypothetical protein Bca52824_000825 [Brassica carinata]
MEEVAAREAFSALINGFENRTRLDQQVRYYRDEKPPRNGHDVNAKSAEVDRTRQAQRTEDSREDFRNTKRGLESLSSRNRYGDSDSSSNWRVKGNGSPNQVRYKEQTREKRKENVSRSSRDSPDSQRTISEAHRYHRYDYQRGGKDFQSRNEPILDWKPVRTEGNRNDGQTRPGIKREATRNSVEQTEEDRRRRMKGKAIAVEGTEREKGTDHDRAFNGENGASGTTRRSGPIDENIPEIQAYPGKNQALLLNLFHQVHGMETSVTKETEKHGTMEEQQLYSDEEMNRIAEQYASVNIEMDEEMVDF